MELSGLYVELLNPYDLYVELFIHSTGETLKVPLLFSNPASFSKSDRLEVNFGFEVVYFFKFATFLEVFRKFC